MTQSPNYPTSLIPYNFDDQFNLLVI